MSPYRNRAANPVTTATAAVGMPSTHPGPNKPVQDLITPIYTGRHLWSAIRPTTLDALPPPLVAYEELPFTNSDRAKLPPCTVRWQFTGRLSINREEDVARGSFRVQVRRYLASKSAVSSDCTVNFPRGVGRGRFVEVTVSPENLAIRAEAQLVFNGSPLQRPCVGANRPKTSLVIEVLEIPLRNAWSETAADIAILLQSHVLVHDIWVARISNSSNSTPPEDTDKMVVLASLPPGEDGRVDPNSFHSLPGYLKIGGAECKLVYAGRLPWCTICRSTSSSYHSFDLCPRRRCFSCYGSGHLAAQYTAEADSVIRLPQPAAPHRCPSRCFD